MGCLPDFLLRQVREDLHNALRKYLLVREGQEGIHEADRGIPQFFNVVLDVLRVARHDRAVVVIDRIGEFIALVGNAGIENEFHPFQEQPGNMPVGQLRRTAFGLTRDGFYAELIHLVG